MEGEEIVPAQTNTWMLPAENTGLWKQFSSLPILNRRSSSVKYCQAILEEDGCTEVDGQLSAAFQTLILITTFDTLTDRDFYWNSHRQIVTDKVSPRKSMTLHPCQWPDEAGCMKTAVSRLQIILIVW